MLKRKLPVLRKGGPGKSRSEISAARRLLRRKLAVEALEARHLLAFIYLDIPGINGGAVSTGATSNSIALEDYSLAIERTSPTAAPAFSNLFFQKTIDSASPALMQEAGFGPVHSAGSTVLRVATDTEPFFGVDQLKFEFDNTRLTQFSSISSNGEQASLAFTKIGYSDTLGVDASGKAIPSNRNTSFNLLNGTASKSIGLFNPNDTITDQTVLTIDGVDLVVDSFDWTATSGKTIDDSGASSPPGKGSEFSFTRPLDKVTAGLLSSIMTGTTYSKVTLSDRRKLPDDSIQKYATWDLSGAFLSKFSIEGDTQSASTAFSIKYSKIDMTYTPSSKIAPELEYSSPATISITADSVTGKFTVPGGSIPAVSKTGGPATGFISFDSSGRVPYTDLQWTLTNNAADTPPAPAFKSEFSSIRFSTPFGQSTPGLLFRLAANVTATTVGINQENIASSDSDDFWKLGNAFISRYQIFGDSNGEPRVDIELSFRDAELTQIRGADGGAPVTKNTANFNQIAQSTTTTTLNFGGAADANSPLKMIVNINGVATEIALDAASWSAEAETSWTRGGGVSVKNGKAEAFNVSFARGIYSPGFFLAAATGKKIDSIKVVRYAEGSSTREQYSYKLEDVFVTNYTTQADADLNSIGNDKIQFLFKKMTLVTKTPPAPGKPEITSETVIDLAANNVSQPADDLAGTQFDAAGTANFPRFKLGTSSLAAPLNFYSTDASSNVAISNKGVRTVTPAQLGGLNYGGARNPSSFFLYRLFSGSAFGAGEFSGSTPFLEMEGDQTPTSKWSLTDAFPIRFAYSDSAGDTTPFVEFGLTPKTLSLQQKQITNAGTVTDGATANWNVPTAQSSLDASKLTPFQYSANNAPSDVLQFVMDGKVLEIQIDDLIWDLKRPVIQGVGTPAVPVPITKPNQTTQTTFDIFAKLDVATVGFFNAISASKSVTNLKIIQRANLFVGGALQYLPYREWTLDQTYITDLFSGVEATNEPGYTNIKLNVGKYTSKFFEYNQSSPAAPFAPGLRIVATSDPTPTQFSNSIDFITPPVAAGIGNFVASSQSTRTIALPSFFSDEQEAASTLTYSFEVLSNPGLFDSVTLDASNNLIIDFKNGVSGIARISVSATDSFGLVATDIIDIGTDVSLDFGDAPAPYKTLLAPGGAAHVATGPRLGATRDSEADGQPNSTATGDGTDEDGVMFGQIIAGGTQAGVNVTLQNATAARVDAWIDFNRDGDWDDEGEKILDNVALISGLQTLNYNLPAGTTAGTTFARVRVSTAGGLGPNGLAADGEVEDYAVTISPPVKVESVVFGDGTAQRSMVKSITVTFDKMVTFDANAFILQRRVGATATTPSASELVINVADATVNGKTVATLTFTGSLIAGGSLSDANWQLTIAGNKVHANGTDLDGDGNGTAGDNYVKGAVASDNFFRLFGDTNGNRLVNAIEFNQFRQTNGLTSASPNYNSRFDYQSNNIVNALDFTQFRLRNGTTLPS